MKASSSRIKNKQRVIQSLKKNSALYTLRYSSAPQNHAAYGGGKHVQTNKRQWSGT